MLNTFQLWEKGSKEAATEGTTVLHIHFSNLSNNSKKQQGASAQTLQQYSIDDHIVDLKRYKAISGEKNFIE